jgi:hypothetical protein
LTRNDSEIDSSGRLGHGPVPERADDDGVGDAVAAAGLDVGDGRTVDDGRAGTPAAWTDDHSWPYHGWFASAAAADALAATTGFGDSVTKGICPGRT